MRTLLTLVTILVLGCGVIAPAAAPAAQHSLAGLAPADEYFGRLKLSILGIRNELRDLRLRAAYNPARCQDVLGTAALVEDAMRDWEHKYPRDPWLAARVRDLTALYAEIHTQQGHELQEHAMQWFSRLRSGE